MFDQEHSGAYCPPGLLVIPRSRLSFPTGKGLLPSVRVFIDHLAAEFTKAVLM
jgi:hypothetical protein